MEKKTKYSTVIAILKANAGYTIKDKNSLNGIYEVIIKDFKKLVRAMEKWKTSVKAAKDRTETKEPKIIYTKSKDINQLLTQEKHTQARNQNVWQVSSLLNNERNKLPN